MRDDPALLALLSARLGALPLIGKTPQTTETPVSIGRSGDGETRTRTGDTTIFSRVLYQLSYLALGR
jgi:hypothetical protein